MEFLTLVLSYNSPSFEQGTNVTYKESKTKTVIIDEIDETVLETGFLLVSI